MAEIVTYTLRELEAKRTEAEKRLKWLRELDWHGLDAYWARMELERIEFLISEKTS